MPFQCRRGQSVEEPDSPGLHDTNFTGPFISATTISATPRCRTRHAIRTPPDPPGPSEPPLPSLDVSGFAKFGPNYQLDPADFPLNGWLRPTERTPRGPQTPFLEEFANVSRDTNDVISSQGVRHTVFTGVMPGNPVDQGTPEPTLQPCFAGQVNKDTLVRRVEPRNAPTVINASLRLRQFLGWPRELHLQRGQSVRLPGPSRCSEAARKRSSRDVYLRIT